MATNNQLLQQIAGADRDGLTNNQLLQVIADNGGGGSDELSGASARIYVGPDLEDGFGLNTIYQEGITVAQQLQMAFPAGVAFYSNTDADGSGMWSPYLMLETNTTSLHNSEGNVVIESKASDGGTVKLKGNGVTIERAATGINASAMSLHQPASAPTPTSAGSVGDTYYHGGYLYTCVQGGGSPIWVRQAVTTTW